MFVEEEHFNTFKEVWVGLGLPLVIQSKELSSAGDRDPSLTMSSAAVASAASGVSSSSNSNTVVVVRSLPAALEALDPRSSKKVDVEAILLEAHQIGDKGAKAFAKLCVIDRFRKLKHVDRVSYHPIHTINISVCALTDGCCPAIGKLISRLSSLRSLRVNGNFITCDGARHIFEALETNSSVTDVHLENNRIGGVKAMDALHDCLAKNRTAFSKALNLQVNPIDDDGFVELCKGLASNFHRITCLNMWRCNLGDDGMAAFAKALRRNRTIEVANFSFNEIGDAGFVEFSDALTVNKTLTAIDVRHNYLTDRAVMSLIPVIIEKNKSLNTIQIENNEAITSEYLVKKLYDHVDRNNIGVVQRYEDKLRREAEARERRRMNEGKWG
jgi:hypothetical protein